MRTSLEITLLPGADRIARLHRRAGAQLDNLCGPYWASILLNVVGVGATQEDVAVAAGTLLPASGDPASWIPQGEPNRDGYGREIRRTDDHGASGTSVAGLVSATSELCSGSFRFIPARARSDEPLDELALLWIVDMVDSNTTWEAGLVLNVRTGKLWGTHLPLFDALVYLSGGEITPPEPEWDVGHFVNVAGVLRGKTQAMLLLRDSYPSFGSAGYHLQPIEAVAAALRRDDGLRGGCLLFVSAEDAPAAERELEEAGFDCNVWDNGTPYEGGTG